ncbi:Lysophospholipase L1 [Pedobacter westerhofensis]|uniref:Lysophospholipase L1 n=1 Tax=Pedobacter westerhofensis TaxID=425512 RepID=A0A521EL47_9SPHI|nr:GDSL-type esterase/lipase family protein [Pedobacter westerhofensis]SMO84649.1 Lysophospholipase L1 [Pedobacter westerhofensis]
MYWYEDEVKRLEKERSKRGYEPEIIFYGSSTMRMWDSLPVDFPNIRIANLGFGGSTLAACVWFFSRLMVDYKPEAIYLYAGDNDLSDGRHPEELLIFFQQMAVHVANRFGDLPCYFISLKPSPSRWHMAEQFRYANNLIESEIIKTNKNWTFIDVFKKMLDKSGQPIPDLYLEDGLHLSEKGYALWKEIVNPYLIPA